MLGAAAQRQRQAVRQTLTAPSVGQALLNFAQWVESLPESCDASPPGAMASDSLRPWARQRIRRMHAKMNNALREANTPAALHQARILAKRLRYGIEALRPLMASRRAQDWHREASGIQKRVGAMRDIANAAEILVRIGARNEADFLRGVVAGLSSRTQSLY
jgi:CHAD domain-containing protein